ncbi:MAG TPA: AI-2E family transporter [Candidatus Dormibacteraeota bacterium]|nr:AI-2E family transporter [Candidatus Dormibacteraeota bacterium]
MDRHAVDDHEDETKGANEMAANAMSTRAAVRLVLVVLLTTSSVLLALWLLYSLQALVVWIILALFLTIALSPVVDWFTLRRVPRALAILTAYLLLLIVIAAIVALAVPALVQQGTQLIHVLQKEGGVGGEAEKLAAPFGIGAAVHAVRPQLDALPAQIASSIGSLTTVTAGTVGVLSAILSVAVLAFFFLHDGASLVEAGVGLLPEHQRPRARRLLNDSSAAISGYIRGNLAISVIAGISALAGMLVLGIPYALPLSAILAVIDLIPMVGVTLGAIPVVLAALTVSPVKAVIMLAYIVAYQQVESNVLNPLIYGRSDRLPPLVVFLAFLIGSLLWGIMGALIAIPVANIIRIIVREWLATRAARFSTPEPAEPAAGHASPPLEADRSERAR